LRRNKNEVLHDLPQKQKSVISVDITNRKEYEKAEENLIEYLKETEGDESARKASKAQHIVQINKLKQLSARGKMKETIDWIENFLKSDDTVRPKARWNASKNFRAGMNNPNILALPSALKDMLSTTTPGQTRIALQIPLDARNCLVDLPVQVKITQPFLTSLQTLRGLDFEHLSFQ
jgi:hypothetical protein